MLKTKLRAEQLEGRDVPTTASLSGGTLKILGDTGGAAFHDHVQVSFGAVSGQLEGLYNQGAALKIVAFREGLVQRIPVGGGNDYPTSSTGRPTAVLAGIFFGYDAGLRKDVYAQKP